MYHDFIFFSSLISLDYPKLSCKLINCHVTTLKRVWLLLTCVHSINNTGVN